MQDDEKKDSGGLTYEIPHNYHHDNKANDNNFDSLEYSSTTDSNTAFGDASVTGQHLYNGNSRQTDATEIVHEMHLALLYLLSNPDEFHKALSTSPSRLATTLAQWNAEYDSESMIGGGAGEVDSVFVHGGGSGTDANSHDSHSLNFLSASTASTPLPFVVFADDAEVVLPQAHTASQLFGLERIDGIELEAAAGIPAISQLFLRWLGEFKRLLAFSLSV
jgi:hypothetical protein